MYGLVNRAVQDLLTSIKGEAGWERVRQRAGHDDDTFVAMQTYPDELTFRLVGAASEELGMPPEQVLHAFGEYWILFTAQKGYGHLLDAFGNSTMEFMSHLNEMHGRVETMFSEMNMPEFALESSSQDGRQFIIAYRSQRQGLAPFVLGLLQGLGKRFNEQLQIRQISDRAQGAESDRFEITVQGS